MTPPIGTPKRYVVLAVNATSLMVNSYDQAEAQAYYNEVAGRDPQTSMMLLEWQGDELTGILARTIVPPPLPGA